METVSIDINCDMGEGGQDEMIIPFITSANIACGGHTGDESTMAKTVELSLKHGTRIGAHPSYPDRENFGRSGADLAIDELLDSLMKQIDSLSQISTSFGARLSHVKLHGSLYNLSAIDRDLAGKIAIAVAQFDSSLMFYGMYGSEHITAAHLAGLRSAGEAFADRNYDSIVELTPRDRNDAMVSDPDEAAARCLDMIRYGRVRSTSGEMLNIKPDTICVHSDTTNAVAIAKAVHLSLTNAGVAIRAPKTNG